MSALMDFLLENDISEVTEEVRISNRIPHKFKIRPMTREERNRFMKQCRSAIKSRGEMDFDTGKFENLVCIECTLEPNFRDADFINKAGVSLPTDLLSKVLLPGEVSELHERICKLSGYGVDGSEVVTDEDVEQAKN